MTNGYELLKVLYETFSPSRNEKKMRKFLKRECEERGAQVVQDNAGNLLVTKGNSDSYPCICAHMDQVQNRHAKDFTVYMQQDVIFAFSAKAKGQQGLGADDKNGIWIALELLAELPALKCAFFVGEEIGCVGSSRVDLDFFSDVRYCIQADRRNGGDLITNISGAICSDEFVEAIGYKDFGYEPTNGLSTDVGTLAHRGVGVSCINISCGYYNPHTDHETTVWGELLNALEFVRHICQDVTDCYPYKYESPRCAYYYNPYNTFKLYPLRHRLQTGIKENNETWRDSFDRIDRRTMRDLLRMHHSMTFEDVLNYHISLFYTTDVDILHDMYEDAVTGL